MPAITIKGIRIGTVTVKRDVESGRYDLETSYALISSADKVLANQSVGGYNGMKLEASPQTQKLLDQFVTSYRADIEMAIGLDASE